MSSGKHAAEILLRRSRLATLRFTIASALTSDIVVNVAWLVNGHIVSSTNVVWSMNWFRSKPKVADGDAAALLGIILKVCLASKGNQGKEKKGQARITYSFLFLVAMPGAPSSVLAPSSDARSP